MNAHPRLALQAQPQQPMAWSLRSVTSAAAWPLPPKPQGSAAIWSLYLSTTAVATSAPGATQPPGLDDAEAARVQRHHDRLMTALQTQDRAALLRAKQDVLEEAYCTRAAPHQGQRSTCATPQQPGPIRLRCAARCGSCRGAWRHYWCRAAQGTDAKNYEQNGR